MRFGLNILFTICILIFFSSCNKDNYEKNYKTENVIIIVVDGPRYSETWGDIEKLNIPHLSNQMSQFGVINTEFYNNGVTKTIPGHTAIATSKYQEIDNSGKELPTSPSIFQYWNSINTNQTNKTWIISSKDKIEVLNNCENADFKNLHMPNSDCGINGNGSGYRHDSITLNKIFDVLNKHRPNLLLVNLREPDYSGHSGSWEKYLEGIKLSDEYSYKIWNFIQENPSYQGKTTLFITNDHGRHLDSISNGFISHGDNCLGCRHINFYASGPDFKQNIILDKKRELIDIAPTISELLGFEMDNSSGQIMYELFK